MSYCPSHDWDNYINEQNKAAEDEVAFYKEHRDRIITVAATLAAALVKDWDAIKDWEVRSVVESAAQIVQEVVSRGEPI